MDAVNQRLACLITASVVLHAMALVPLKARHSPSPPLFAPLLTVDLFSRQAPAAALPVPTPTAPVAVREAPGVTSPQVATVTQAQPEAAGKTPRTPTQSPDETSPPQLATEPAAPIVPPAASVSDEAISGVRLALADEVSVRVEMLSYESGLKPKDILQFEGRTYHYFKSPDLRRPTQPLDDIHPHYPAKKPYYVHGAVKLQLLIDEAGTLEQANVLCSNPDFEKSALASIEHLRFTPAQTVAGPVKSYMVVEFGFGNGYPCQPVPDIRPSR